MIVILQFGHRVDEQAVVNDTDGEGCGTSEASTVNVAQTDQYATLLGSVTVTMVAYRQCYIPFITDLPAVCGLHRGAVLDLNPVMSALRVLSHTALRQSTRSCPRLLHASATRRSEAGGFSNILAGGPTPPVQVKTITNEGIELADGLVLPGACIFLDGKVFLWDVPETRWEGWDKKHFEIFDVVVPKPGECMYRLHKRNTSAF